MKLQELHSSLIEQVFLTEEDLWEMATLGMSSTGVKVNIWIGPTDKRHGFRIKVRNFIGKNKFNNSECFVITIDNEPKHVAGRVLINNDIFNDVIDWVKINKDELLNIEREMETGADTVKVIAPMLSNLKKI